MLKDQNVTSKTPRKLIIDSDYSDDEEVDGEIYQNQKQISSDITPI